MSRIVEPAVRVPRAALLSESPARVSVVPLPVPLHDSLDLLVDEVNEQSGRRATVRSRLVSALILTARPDKTWLSGALATYLGASVQSASGRAPDARDLYSFPRHDPGPRSGVVPLRVDLHSASDRLSLRRQKRVSAFLMPLAINERLDRLARLLATPNRTSGPARQLLIAAFILDAVRHASMSDIRWKLAAYETASVLHAVAGPVDGEDMLTFKRYGPGPRPPLPADSVPLPGG